MKGDLLETLDGLLKVADPEGRNYVRLLKIRDQVTRNVMIGPKALRFVERMVQRVSDNVECRNVLRDGQCRLPRIPDCDHTENYKECPHYDPARPGARGNLLQPEGGNHAR